MAASRPDMRAFAPVTDEVELRVPAVTGTIPRELNGSLLRNGPNPFSGRFAGEDVQYWWPEAAMLHGITFAAGEVPTYRNRWVRTRQWAGHFAVTPTAAMVDSNPNINVIRHAGHVLALAEGGMPARIDRMLHTLGPATSLGSFSAGMASHPKFDPVTGELITFRADWRAPWLRYGVVDAGGRTTLDRQIDVPAPAMMHDMAITATHSILMDLHVAYDFSMLQRGFRLPICWQDDRRSRLAVMPRHGGEVTWLDIEPCFIQHVVNAYDDADGRIVLDVVRYPSYFRIDRDGTGFSDNPLGVLWRYTVDLQRRTVTEAALDDLHIELPRIDDRRTGRQNRYLYAVEQPVSNAFRGIVRYDLVTGSRQHHRIDEGDQNSEPVFVPRPGGVAEDDGWLLVCVYRCATDSSEIRLLHAADIAAPPVATVALDRRIPAGFHGAWIPAH